MKLSPQEKEGSKRWSQSTRDAMWSVASMLSSGDFRYVRLDGDALYRGKSLIRYISFENEIDPDDIE